MPEPQSPREGEVAFAVSVATLYDLTIGRTGWPVYFTRHSSGDQYTLTLANRTPGGPVLNILDYTLTHSVFSVSEEGMQSSRISGYLDLMEQDPPPLPPAPGSGELRMYHRDGNLWFLIDGSPIEHQIPIGDPPGPSMRYAFWLGGG